MLTISQRTTPRDGEAENGDAIVVRREEAATLIAVVDGLGHGHEAAGAAAEAVRVLDAWSPGDGIEDVMLTMHQRLRGTRGVAATVCVVGDRAITGCAVGNVELRCVGSQPPVVMSPGVLGTRVSAFRVFRGDLAPGSRLHLFSDGFAHLPSLDTLRYLPPGEVCDRFMRSYRVPSDDASIVVCDLENP